LIILEKTKEPIGFKL